MAKGTKEIIEKAIEVAEDIKEKIVGVKAEVKEVVKLARAKHIKNAGEKETEVPYIK